MEFGPDVNAYTGFDETVYMLTVPTNSAEVVDTAFQIFEDWAHQMSLEDEEIDKDMTALPFPAAHSSKSPS